MDIKYIVDQLTELEELYTRLANGPDDDELEPGLDMSHTLECLRATVDRLRQVRGTWQRSLRLLKQTEHALWHEEISKYNNRVGALGAALTRDIEAMHEILKKEVAALPPLN